MYNLINYEQSTHFIKIAPCFLGSFKGAARGVAEGAQAPPLAIRILMFIS